MSKRFWAGCMLFCLFVTMSSGSYLYMRIKDKSTVEVPLQTISDNRKPQSTQKEEPIQKETEVKEDPVVTEQASVPAPPTKVEAVKKEATPKTRNILFSLYSSTAKEVFIIGDFNEWYREPLEKSGKTWQVAKKLTPGKYKYLYVVDGRRVRDPNNKKTSADGRSILTVKPLSGS